jgi:hypothetical protein
MYDNVGKPDVGEAALVKASTAAFMVNETT